MRRIRRVRAMHALLGGCMLLAGCREQPASPPPQAEPPAPATVELREGKVTISGDDSVAALLTWRAPRVDVTADNAGQAQRDARDALREGRLYEDATSAIPLYLALRRLDPEDRAAQQGLARAAQVLLARGDIALELAGDDLDALQMARAIAAVARTAVPDARQMGGYLERVDLAERLWALNAQAEGELRRGALGLDGTPGAMRTLRQVLTLRPEQPRALQTAAAVESAAIRQAEIAAGRGDVVQAGLWLGRASVIRDNSDTITDGWQRVDAMRQQHVRRLRDDALAGLHGPQGLTRAHQALDTMLAMTAPSDPAVGELRQRIRLATHYGLFRPGQVFTDALHGGGRGPQMVVVPHGAFVMGAPQGEFGAQEAEQPVRTLRLDRGFAMAVREVTVAEFRRYVQATQTRTRAMRRGYSLVWEERSANFVRHSGVDWRSDYAGASAADALPVLHVSARDADGYAQWLSEQTGERYRLPSEAEFEYALRAGRGTRYPWGDGHPSPGIGNVTGAGDRSPTGRNWRNAFDAFDDGHWGPAPTGTFKANAYGLHDLSGNVSEWVADCWHHGYRRAPIDVAAWFNPGCRTRVIRGGSWSSAPAQIRSAWRAPADVDTTNAHIGFRVARDL